MSAAETLEQLVARPARGRRTRGRAAGSAPRVVGLRHGRRDRVVRRALLLADATALLAALVLTRDLPPRPQTALLVLIVLGSGVGALRAYGLYQRDAKRINHATLDELPALFHAFLLACSLIWVLCRVTPAPNLRFGALLSLALAGFALVVALRMLARRVVKRSLGRERSLLVGDDASVALIARKLAAHPEYGTEPVGVLARSGVATAAVAGLPVLGGIDGERLAALAGVHGIARVVVADDALTEPELLGVLRRCRELGLKVSILPQLVDLIGPAAEIDEIEGVTLLAINPPVLGRTSRCCKRALDVLGASAGLLLAAPLLLAAAVAILLESGRPVLFRQRRVGRRGRCFQLLKLRTMSADAEERRGELLVHSRDPHWLDLADDPRVTRSGRLLRRSSLDELPQLWNVLKGEMSLVGPRPLIEDDDAQLSGWARSRIDLAPGLTGLWQVLGRTSIPFEEMVELDYRYVTNWSLWTDVRLLLRTLPVVLARRGAN